MYTEINSVTVVLIFISEVLCMNDVVGIILHIILSESENLWEYLNC